jgi:hemolysin activation/secretion protein
LALDRIRESPLANVTTSSLFGTRHFTPNPSRGVASGWRNSATFRYSFTNIRSRTWSHTLLEVEARAAGGRLGGDLDFVRWEANVAGSFRLAPRLYLDTRVRGGLATGRLPLQEQFYAGSVGTLPGYEDYRFLGDRTLLGRTRVSVVPFGAPEEDGQFRVFTGLDAGDAWLSDRTSGIPHLRTDMVVGAGLFSTHVGRDAVLFPPGMSIAWARPLDRGFGAWRFQFDFFSGATR